MYKKVSRMSGHSVDFSGSNIYFQFLNLDVSGSVGIDASYMDLFFVPGFSGTDATATLNVPVDKFSRLFWVNMKFQDLVDSANLKYAIDPTGWNNGDPVPFSQAVVTNSTAVNPSVAASRQQIKQDFVRFIMKEITGSLYMNSLFRNKASLVSSTAAADQAFQSSIQTVLSSCGGTFASPADSTTVNPVNILMNSILGEDDDGVDNFNDARKAVVLSYFKDKLTARYNVAKTKKFYAYGLGEEGLGYYYPLYIDPSHSDLSATGSHVHRFSGSSTLASTGVTYRSVDEGAAGATVKVQHSAGGLNILRFDPDNPDRSGYRMMLRVDTDDNAIAFNTIIGEPGYSDVDMSGVANWRSGSFDFSGYYHHHFVSQPMQAESMSEFGTACGLTGKAGKKLKSVKVAFDSYNNGTKYSMWSSDPRYAGQTSGYVVPVTLTFYAMDSEGETGNTLGKLTSNLTMDWCPETRGPSGDGYNGWAFTRTVDVSSLNMVVPSNETVIVTVAYNTQSWGANPVGVNGPYNSLNLALMPTSDAGVVYGTSAGTYPKENGFYIKSGFAGFYKDGCVSTPLKTICVDKTVYVIGATTSGGVLTSTGELVAASVMAKASSVVTATGTSATIVAFPPTNLGNYSMDYVGMNFYMPNTGGNHAVNPKPTFDPTTYTDYATVDSSFTPFPFQYGDTLSVKLTYYPKSNTVAGRPVGHRSYLVNLTMGLESLTSVPYNALGNGDGPLIVAYDNTLGMNYAQTNGVNKGFLYLLWNGLTTNPLVSPANYYPTMADIASIRFQTNCNSSDAALNRSWFLSIYTRPRPGGGAIWYGTRLNAVPKAGPPNTWTQVNLGNVTFENNFVDWGNWDAALARTINQTTSYGYVDTFAQEQLLGVAISTDSSTPTFTGKIADVVVTFKDGRVIKFV
jgi:hypothetical protein